MRLRERVDGMETKTSLSFFRLTGTRESAHPIHRYLGVCPLARLGKKVGSAAEVAAAQAL